MKFRWCIQAVKLNRLLCFGFQSNGKGCTLFCQTLIIQCEVHVLNPWWGCFPCSLPFYSPLFLPSGSNYYVRILSTIDRELLKPNASVALHKHSNALVDVLPPEADSSIMMLTSGKTLSASLSWGISGCRVGKHVEEPWSSMQETNVTVTTSGNQLNNLSCVALLFYPLEYARIHFLNRKVFLILLLVLDSIPCIIFILMYCDSSPRPKARCDVCWHRWYGHPETGSQRGSGAATHPLWALQTGQIFKKQRQVLPRSKAELKCRQLCYISTFFLARHRLFA